MLGIIINNNNCQLNVCTKFLVEVFKCEMLLFKRVSLSVTLETLKSAPWRSQIFLIKWSSKESLNYFTKPVYFYNILDIFNPFYFCSKACGTHSIATPAMLNKVNVKLAVQQAE